MLRLKAKRRRPFRAALLTATLLAIVIAYFNAHPIALSTENARAEGTLESSTGSQDVDVLVVLWGHQIAHSSESRDYDAIDKSWAWVETVRREIGPVAVIEPDELTQRLLERYHVVVVTHSAAVHDQMDSQVHIFEHFVSHGGTLILERPQGAMRTAFSADGLGGTRTPTQVTAANGVTDDVAEALRQVPLRTKFIGSTGPLEGSETLLSMDGAPVLYRLERSGGHVVTVDFDYGAALYNLMQGCPSGEGFEVRDSQSPPSVDRLVCDDRLRQSE
ncbi:MAG: hypothetical protein KC561_18820, partial [Myxococcales bacterium]|nr:hypothetical protein [Myxococcales bacterium]